MLHELAEANSAGVGTHRYAVLRRHQQHGENLVHAAKPTRVDLTEVQCLRLEHLLEQHPVHPVLSRGHLHWGNGLPDGGMTQHIVGTGGLLDP
jgi:hypothetical protein